MRFPVVVMVSSMIGGLLGVFLLSRLAQFLLKPMGDGLPRLVIADIVTLGIVLGITHFTMPGQFGLSLLNYGVPTIAVLAFDLWLFVNRRNKAPQTNSATFD